MPVMNRIAGDRCLAGLMVALTGSLMAVFALAATPVGAESPFEIVGELVDDGVYIAPGRTSDAEPAMFVAVIEQARADGVSLAVVWPDDPQPNTGAFARRVQEASMADVVLVFGPEDTFGSFVAEDYEERAIRASAAARAVDEPAEKASAYLTGLLEEPVRERPAIINELVRWIVLLLAALVVGAVGEQMIRAFKKSRKRQKLRTQSETAG